MAANSWTWTEDRQWASSRLLKNWSDDRFPMARVLAWQLEVRTENIGAGTERMGELVLTGSFNGTLTMRLEEVNEDAFQ